MKLPRGLDHSVARRNHGKEKSNACTRWRMTSFEQYTIFIVEAGTPLSLPDVAPASGARSPWRGRVQLADGLRRHVSNKHRSASLFCS
jgi:hypothetical protein